MKTKTIGLTLFWIAAVYMIVMGFLGSFLVRSTYRFNTMEEVSQTIWAFTKPLFPLWAMAIPLGAIIAAIGLLIYVRVRKSHIWLIGLGVFSVFLLDMLTTWRILPEPVHTPVLFGIGGGLITIFFLVILWFWAKEYGSHLDQEKTGAELQLVGYVFLMIAMWFLCGEFSRPFQLALKDLPIGTPLAIIVYLVLGWLFLTLSHFKSAQSKQN